MEVQLQPNQLYGVITKYNEHAYIWTVEAAVPSDQEYLKYHFLTGYGFSITCPRNIGTEVLLSYHSTPSRGQWIASPWLYASRIVVKKPKPVKAKRTRTSAYITTLYTRSPRFAEELAAVRATCKTVNKNLSVNTEFRFKIGVMARLGKNKTGAAADEVRNRWRSRYAVRVPMAAAERVDVYLHRDYSRLYK